MPGVNWVNQTWPFMPLVFIVSMTFMFASSNSKVLPPKASGKAPSLLSWIPSPSSSRKPKAWIEPLRKKPASIVSLNSPELSTTTSDIRLSAGFASLLTPELGSPSAWKGLTM